MNSKENKASKLFFFLLGQKSAKLGIDISLFPGSRGSNIFRFFIDGWNNYKKSQVKETSQNEN